MRLLLDTHALLWWDDDLKKLSDAARSALEDEANTVFISVVNAWEIQIKVQLGKPGLTRPLPEIIQTQRLTNGFELLPIELPHILALDGLSLHHRDPFDRLLIAQARHEQLTLVSRDPRFAAYPVKVLW